MTRRLLDSRRRRSERVFPRSHVSSGSSSLPLKFSTPLRIAPDTLPFRAPVATVLAASFHPLTAAEAIVSAFGTDMAEETEAATAVPLPVQLGETTVKVTDRLGVQRDAQLFFVSPGQTNFLVPAGSATGPGTVEVLRNGSRISQGQIMIDPLAPGLFSANGSGQGIAAAIAITVKADGTQQGKAIAEGEAGRAVPVSLGAASDSVFLSLYGTGMRKTGAATATVGGQAVGVAGPVPVLGFPGLDQVNLGPLPRSLAGAGEAAIMLAVDGVRANVVTVAIE